MRVLFLDNYLSANDLRNCGSFSESFFPHLYSSLLSRVFSNTNTVCVLCSSSQHLAVSSMKQGGPGLTESTVW